MLALGGLLSCAAVLATVGLALIFRNPNPPRWTTSSWAGELTAVGLVCVFALGLGYIGSGVISAYQQGPSAIDLALLGVVLVAASIVWRKLNLRARLKALDAGVRAPTLVAVGEPAEGVPVPAPEPPPSRPTRRAA